MRSLHCVEEEGVKVSPRKQRHREKRLGEQFPPVREHHRIVGCDRHTNASSMLMSIKQCYILNSTDISIRIAISPLTAMTAFENDP